MAAEVPSYAGVQVTVNTTTTAWLTVRVLRAELCPKLMR